MAFERWGNSGFEYNLCKYGTSKLSFRGPKQRLDKPYVAIIGGAETFGKFMEAPYPVLLAEILDFPVINLGYPAAGIDVFLKDQGLVDICSKASVGIIEILSAQNQSNVFYKVHPRRNDRFVMATARLHSLYPDVDFTEIHFTGHLLAKLSAMSLERFELIKQELKSVWVSKMKRLINAFAGPTYLLKLSEVGCGDLGSGWVDDQMLGKLKNRVTGTVDCIVSAEEVRSGLERMNYTIVEEPEARGMFGPIAHQIAAQRIEAALQDMGMA